MGYKNLRCYIRGPYVTKTPGVHGASETLVRWVVTPQPPREMPRIAKSRGLAGAGVLLGRSVVAPGEKTLALAIREHLSARENTDVRGNGDFGHQYIPFLVRQLSGWCPSPPVAAGVNHARSGSTRHRLDSPIIGCGRGLGTVAARAFADDGHVAPSFQNTNTWPSLVSVTLYPA